MSTSESTDKPAEPAPSTLREVAMLSLRLGATTFGGPAAHIAVLQDEIVHKRHWLDQQAFTHMLGLTNLLPGPNSTEMVMHAGYVRAGYRGLLAAGFGFILPGVGLTLLLAMAYREWGSSEIGMRFLIGVQAAVIAVLVQALWRLLAGTERDAIAIAGIGIVAVLAALGAPELPLLFAGGAVLGSIRIAKRQRQTMAFGLPAALALMPLAVSGGATPYSDSRLFLAFLKIGGLLYGSGYVLVSLLRGTFVDDLGWLTEQQVIDAVAAGQITPGPLFSTATFIGYDVGGFTGAAVATVGIFLPAFLFVALAAPLLPRIAGQPSIMDLLHGVSLAAIGLLVGVTIVLARSVLDSWETILIAVLAAAALLVLRFNSALVIVFGGLLALALHVITTFD
jgi:chromate transporter